MARPPRPRVKACSECRQQKLRCDAYQDYSQPCSRCKKLQLHCLVSTSFKRTNKQTKAQMREEIERLRQQTQVAQTPATSKTEGTSTATPGTASNIVLQAPDTVQSILEPWAAPSIGTPVAMRSPPASTSMGSLQNGRDDTTLARSIYSDQPRTTAQTLDGVELSPQKIDACFALYFQHYSQYLPILDPDCSPDQYYARSPFLFWTVVGVGARRYAHDPTILERLGGRIISLAFSCLSSLCRPINIIEGLLLLCTWPIPINTMFKDISHVFGGAGIQLALQNGLHIFGHRQDFSRTRLWPDKNEDVNRARLWAYCLIAFQGTSLGDGLPPSTVVDSFDFDRQKKDAASILPPDLQYRHKLHKIQTNAVTTITSNRLTLDIAQDTSLLDSLIEVFDAQAQEVKSDSPNELSAHYLDCTRLYIRAFHFFAAAEAVNIFGLIELYSIACKVIDGLIALDVRDDFTTYCTNYSTRMVFLAADSILKLSRSHLSHFLDLKAGERAYFAAIHLCRKRSLRLDDLDARNGIILTQLWSSDKIFRRSNGTTDSLRLRLRSRLSMSVIFDCFWWWRAEFGGQSNPYTDPGESRGTHGLLQEQTDALPISIPTFSDRDMMLTSVDANDLFPDWQWAAGLTFPVGNEISFDIGSVPGPSYGGIPQTIATD